MPDTKTPAAPVVLSRGAHEPDGEYCLMEHISVRAGLPWTDHPECTHPVLAAAARNVNDQLGDEERQALLDLEDDLLAAPPRPGLEPRLSVHLAVWSAAQVLPAYEASYPGDRRPHQAIEAAKAWLADPSESNRKAAAAAVAEAVAVAVAEAYPVAVAEATAAAVAVAEAYAVAEAAAVAAAARSSAAAIPGPVDLLRGLIGQYQELAAADAMRSEHPHATQGDHS